MGNIFIITIVIVLIALINAFLYEIKFTYRDGDLWKK